MKPTPFPVLAPGRRFLGVLVAWVLLVLASPGNTGRDGSLVLAIVGAALFAYVLAHPLGPRPRRALLFEFAAHSLGGALYYLWARYVLAAVLIYMGPGWALWFLPIGLLLRRLTPRLPLSLAFALAFTGVEVVRAWTPLPVGMGWLRLGHYTHHHLWLSGSARVWGVEGLTFVVALLAGAAAAHLRARRLLHKELLLAGGGVALALVLALLVRPPETEPGPRVLVVQPGIEQERLGLEPPGETLEKLKRMSFEALDEAGPVDLVAWGESMLYHLFFTEEFLSALRAGGALPPWWRIDEDVVRYYRRSERRLVGGELYGGGSDGAFPPGTWFLAGGEEYWAAEGRPRRTVVVALYDGTGKKVGTAGKRYLCSGSETLHGLDRFGPVRDLLVRLGGYVPDFSPPPETGVFELTTREGATHRFSASLCFDNAFLEPYLDAARRGPLAFHLVASNEAWFRESFEMDQMVAFSRVAALATGRAFVRATTSGVSLLIGPDGRELGRIESEGRDRAVAGTEVFEVPVPRNRKQFPPYVAFAGLWRVLAVLLLAGALFPRDRGNRPQNPG